MNDIFKTFDNAFEFKKANARSYSPLVLAYIGDGIYELFIRTYVVKSGNAPVNKLHQKSKAYVQASAQRAMYHKIEPMLTEEEIAMFKRGRNAKSGTKAKNASMSDYRVATGFEAMIGYLYLNEEYDRITELIVAGIKDDEAN